MKTITAKQREELEHKLNWLKKAHPRRYKYLDFHLNDFGDRVALGMVEPKGGAFWRVTMFMSYEAMYITLELLERPIDKEINKNKDIWKECKVI